MRLRRPGRRAATLTGCAAMGVAGAVVLGLGLSTQGGTATAGTTAGTVAAAPSGAPPAAEGTAADPAAWTAPPSSAVHVEVPALGLHLPVLPLSVPRGVIDPPLVTAAYWIEPYGAPVGNAGEADNTLYLAAHSTSRGTAGFDPLLTADHEGSALQPGDVVSVSTPEGTVGYTVERTARYDQDELAAATDVWQAVPGRLVLITCLTPLGGGDTTQNLVVFASSLT